MDGEVGGCDGREVGGKVEGCVMDGKGDRWM